MKFMGFMSKSVKASRKIFVLMVLSALMVPLFAEGSALQQYYGQLFKGNMMGKIITADMTILDEDTVDFTANVPGKSKQQFYSYKIVSEADGKIVTEWYDEEGNLDKTVTFMDLEADSFVMEVKGKGKVKMQKQ